MRSLSSIIAVTLLGAAYCFHIIVEDEGSPVANPEIQSPLQSEEFQEWLQVQRELTVQKIMDKISDPSDTIMQQDAKIVVARYLVNVTFAAMTRRLENYGKSIPESFIPESITTAVPTGENGTVPEQPTITLSIMPMETELGNNGETEQIIEEKITILVEEATSGPIDEETTAPVVEETTIISIQEEIVPIIIDTKIINQSPQGSGPILPASSPNQQSLPASSPVTTAPESEPIIPTIFVNRKENQTVPASSPDNSTETTTSGPIWQQLLTFNFSALSGGGGGGVRLPFNISLTGLRGEGGSRLPFNLSLSALRGEGGNRLPFNFTLPSIGGEGGSPRLPFNLTALRGEGGARLPFNISLTALGGEGGARLPFNLSFPAIGGEGGPRLPFNISLSGLLNNNNNNSSNSSAASEGSGIFFNLPPPPDFNFPTPPPMNDSVRMSQMYLMAQVDKLVSGINSQNLTGVLDSTVNLATPSSVGVLVNALLNLVLCNPLDRWHGNCGI